MTRRDALAGGMALIASGTMAAIYRPEGKATFVGGGHRWKAAQIVPPTPVDPAKRVFLSDPEFRTVSAIFDRLIPADDISIGATEAGCVTFVDHQLAGPYGQGATRYTKGPFLEGDPYQGNQSVLSPAQYYRKGLPEVDKAAQTLFGKPFADCTPAQQDAFLEKLEAGDVKLDGIDAKTLFQQFLANAREGYFADPLYGGNRGMVGWKMVGFPGARYDYRDYIERKGEVLNIAPVSLFDRA
jgi:gluconate 2-dehydrogenase gamma chain